MAGLKTLGIALVLAFVLAPASLFGQKSKVPASATNATALSIGTQQSDPDRPALQHRNPRYRIQRDDVLFMSFALSPELNQTVAVQPDGYINLEGAESLYVLGMTVPEIVEALKQSYSKVLHDPIINVDLVDFQKPFFIVAGQVAKPGQYDLRYDTTVLEAIAIAGGFVPQAKTQVLLYHRVSDGWVEVSKLNLRAILHGKNVNEDTRMQPGDMIFVPEKFITNFRKYVPYSFGMNPQIAIIN